MHGKTTEYETEINNISASPTMLEHINKIK